MNFVKLWGRLNFNKTYLLLTFMLLFSIPALGLAQTGTELKVVINGNNLNGVDDTLIVNVPYAPINSFEEVLGLKYSYNTQQRLLQVIFAGHLVNIRSYDTPSAAAADNKAFSMAGASLEGNGAILKENRIYVPIRPLIIAFGGSIEYFAELRSLIAVFKRAEIRLVRTPNAGQGYARFVVYVSEALEPRREDIASIGVVSYRFAQSIAVEQTINASNESQGFNSALIRSLAGDAEFRLNLNSGFVADSYINAAGAEYGNRGLLLIVDILPESIYRQKRAGEQVREAQSLLLNFPSILASSPASDSASDSSSASSRETASMTSTLSANTSSSSQTSAEPTGSPAIRLQAIEEPSSQVPDNPNLYDVQSVTTTPIVIDVDLKSATRDNLERFAQKLQAALATRGLRVSRL
ncbi:MAG: hypothetical protein R2880_03035 [Deinococcales bacterium]